jgi:Na+/proline symporter
MELTVIFAIILSFIVYLGVGYVINKKTKSVADMLPIADGYTAEVKSITEFGASTTAASISLVTVIMFFFEAAPGMGPYLYWCVLTTIGGIFLVRFLIKKMWARAAVYENRPSLHEFIGYQFASEKLTIVGAICTSISYLATYAVETYVGSLFLSALIPTIPQYAFVLILTIVGFIYTLSGFRTVVLTDVIQMWCIYLFGILMLGFFIWFILKEGNSIDFHRIPALAKSFQARDGLSAFMSGIFVINLCMFLVSMSLFQRIAACKRDNLKLVKKGLDSSMINVGISWSIFIVAAVLVYLVITPVGGTNTLMTFLKYIGTAYGAWGKVFLFIAVLGLFGALLSTASTNLVAVSQSIYNDIINVFRKVTFTEQLQKADELKFSRIVLVCSAVVSMGIIALLSKAGYSITQLAFIVYGGQLSLFAPVLFAILFNKNKLKYAGKVAPYAVALGMLASWTMAIAGKEINNANIVLFSPCASLVISFSFIGLVYLFSPSPIDDKRVDTETEYSPTLH